ncbi:MAG: glycosyltransferase family 2 protein [Terriglobia bacterium]
MTTPRTPQCQPGGEMASVHRSVSAPWQYALIIPALNEEKSIGRLLELVSRGRFVEIIVVDNGSADGTARVAAANGVRAILEPRRGYGQACLTGIAGLGPRSDAVAFMDADLSDDPTDLARLLDAFESSGADLVIGSRVLGHREPGSLTPLQRFGNWLSTRLILLIWNVRYTDLGPLRVVSREALRRMALTDRDFGWTAEMQAMAAKLGMRVAEIPVSYRRRIAGKSKVSGTLMGSLRAGVKILTTIAKCWLFRKAEKPV